MFGTPILPPLSTLTVAAVAGTLVFQLVNFDTNATRGQHVEEAEAVERERSVAESQSPRRYLAAAFDPAMLERPLFSRSRRPVEPQTEPVSKPDSKPEQPVADAEPKLLAEPPRIALKGTMHDGEMRTALIEVAGQAPRWFGANAVIEGWRISEIGGVHIILMHGDRSYRVDMHD